jgi:plasmid stabilization system protein ParE
LQFFCGNGTVSAQSHHVLFQENTMPRGDKSKYTDKEKRQAQHIEEGYEERGVPTDESERRAWATVNAVHGGGEKPGGGGFGKPENHEPMRKGGRNSHKH